MKHKKCEKAKRKNKIDQVLDGWNQSQTELGVVGGRQMNFSLTKFFTSDYIPRPKLVRVFCQCFCCQVDVLLLLLLLVIVFFFFLG